MATSLVQRVEQAQVLQTIGDTIAGYDLSEQAMAYAGSYIGECKCLRMKVWIVS